MKIIDAHNHLVWPFNEPEWREPVLLDPQVLIGSGLFHRVWVMSTGNCFRHDYGDENERILQLARSYPDFIVPFAYLDFEAPIESIDAFHEQGFAGLKAIFPPASYDDERFFPFYERAEQLRMPVYFHVGGSPYWHPAALNIPPRRLASRHMMIQTLDLPAKLFPELAIVCAHMGGAHSYDFALYFARGHARVYLDMSCSILRDEPDRIRHVLAAVGADKVLFGSDTRGDGPIRKARFWRQYFEAPEFEDREAGAEIMGGVAERILCDSSFDPAKLR